MGLIEPHAEGWIVSVKAQAGARRNEIRGQQDGALKICVTQAPEQGKANSALRDQLAESLGVKKSQIELIAGETSTRKRFLIRQISRAELELRVSRCFDSH